MLGRRAGALTGYAWLLGLAVLYCGCQREQALPPGTFDSAEAGTLRVYALGLGACNVGEATLIVGTDGQRVLLDVGNDCHAEQVMQALEALGGPALDAVVLTHAHADHLGGFDALLKRGLVLNGPVVHRGAVDLGDANASELAPVLAHPASEPLCDSRGCGGLPWRMSLGEASLELFAANGVVATSSGLQALELGLDEENARSIAGVLSLGDFQYVFGGDLTGGGKGTPDVESAIAALGPEIAQVRAGEVDLLHLNHHGISSSTSPAWASWLLGSGRSANVIVGANQAYLDAPSEEALDVVRPKLGSGAVWVTGRGRLSGADPIVRDAGGTVLIEVSLSGSGQVSALDQAATRFDAGGAW